MLRSQILRAALEWVIVANAWRLVTKKPKSGKTWDLVPTSTPPPPLSLFVHPLIFLQVNHPQAGSSRLGEALWGRCSSTYASMPHSTYAAQYSTCLDAAQRRTSLRHDQVSQYNTCSSKALMLHNNGVYRERRINQMPG